MWRWEWVGLRVTSAGALPSVILTASWDAGAGSQPGSGGTAHLARQTGEDGEYAGH